MHLLALVVLVGVCLYQVALVIQGAASAGLQTQEPLSSPWVFANKPSPLFVFQPSVELGWLKPDIP